MLLSVIIPVYNVEQYLHQCIDSVLASTFKDYELILVDDGSPDRSGAICDEFAVKDCRIKVIHVANGGVSKARNIGIDHSTASWITFIDADDFISPMYLQCMYEAVECHPKVDFVHAGCLLYGENHKTTKEYLYPNKYSDDKNFLLSEFRGLPFSKLYRKDIIEQNNIRFDECMKSQEDLIFCLDYILHVNYYAFLDSYEYFHRTDNASSIMHSSFSPSYEYSLHAASHFFEGVDRYVSRFDVTELASVKRKRHAAESLSFAIYSLFLSGNYSFAERTAHLKNDFGRKQISYLKYVHGKKNRMLYFILNLGCSRLFNILMSNLIRK